FANLAFHVIGTGHDVVEVAVFLQPLYRRLGATLVDPGDVVHLVAHQGQIVDDLLRGDTEFFHHAVAVHAGFSHGIDQGDMVAYQLGHVLVAGGNDDVDALASGLMGQGADDIVRLHLRNDQQR